MGFQPTVANDKIEALRRVATTQIRSKAFVPWASPHGGERLSSKDFGPPPRDAPPPRQPLKHELRWFGQRVFYLLMRVGLFYGMWVAVAVLLGGCGTFKGNKTGQPAAGHTKASKASAANADAEPDYSPEAVERRTEAHARFATGFIHYLNDDLAQAADQYYQAALAEPDSEQLVMEATRMLLQTKQPDKAVEVLVQAVAQPGAPGTLDAQLGRVYALAGKKEQAIEANRRAIHKAPKSLPGYQHLAQIHFQSNQPDQGLAVLDEAARQADVDASFLVDLAELYLTFGRTLPPEKVRPRALNALTRAAKLNSGNPLLLTRLADALSLLGESDQAVEIYAKMLERFPQFPGLREKLTALYLGKDDGKRAAEMLESIIRDNPTNARAYYDLGDIALKEGRHKDALEHFRKALLLKADLVEAYYALARTHIALSQPREALDTLQRAPERLQRSFFGEFFSGCAYAQLKEYTNAVKRFTEAEVIARATATNLLTPFFYFQFAAAYERAQNYEEAEQQFRKCLSLAPDNSEALNYLGYMWAERGTNLREARELIQKAVDLEPKNAAYLDSMGWVLFKLDQPSEALDYLLKAIGHSEEPDATLYDHLGDIYAKLNQPEKAREAWLKALSLEPNENKAQIQKKLGAAEASTTTGAPLR